MFDLLAKLQFLPLPILMGAHITIFTHFIHKIRGWTPEPLFIDILLYLKLRGYNLICVSALLFHQDWMKCCLTAHDAYLAKYGQLS